MRDVASRFVSATNAKTLPPLTLALALDPRAQGRVVWFRRAEEFCNILNDNEDEKIFSGAPQFAEMAPVAQENDVVVILQAGARSRKLILFASDGVARR
ncbi:MAG: hypothetical protein HUK22_00145 [Thermoguttaceae bacterium]|nr:hypothetical protein [Thermoguttaceae bacterium]